MMENSKRNGGWIALQEIYHSVMHGKKKKRENMMTTRSSWTAYDWQANRKWPTQQLSSQPVSYRYGGEHWVFSKEFLATEYVYLASLLSFRSDWSSCHRLSRAKWNTHTTTTKITTTHHCWPRVSVRIRRNGQRWRQRLGWRRWSIPGRWSGA